MATEQPQVLSQLREYSPTKTVGLISDTHIPVRARDIQKSFRGF